MACGQTLDRIRNRLKHAHYRRQRRAYLRLLGYPTDRHDERRSIADIAHGLAALHNMRGRVDEVIKKETRKNSRDQVAFREGGKHGITACFGEKGFEHAL